jgi:tetratricopeptide (TPR) repeat protein
MSQETVLLPSEQTDQTVSANVAATEVLPAPKTPLIYETEEMPQVRITAEAEKSATAVVANAPVTQSQKKHGKAAPANRLSGGRKRLALAVSLGVVALAAISFFFVISRRPPETQGANLPADKAELSTSAQPVAQQSNQQSGQQSGAGANNQAQPQTGSQAGPAISEVKSPATRNTEAASNPQRQAVAKPTPATSQDKQPAGGTISAEDNLNQGMTYLSARRYQEALQEFEQVKKLDPGNKNVYYLIGQTYHGMNQLEQALEAYRQCTSGIYASVAQSAAKRLEKKVGKINAR